MSDDQQFLDFPPMDFDPRDPAEPVPDPDILAKKLPRLYRGDRPERLPESLSRKREGLRRRILIPKRYRPKCIWPLEGDECEGAVHLHHTWPVAIFGREIADAMPFQPLCAKHHDTWHDAVQVYYVQMFIELEDRVHGRR